MAGRKQMPAASLSDVFTVLEDGGVSVNAGMNPSGSGGDHSANWMNWTGQYDKCFNEATIEAGRWGSAVEPVERAGREVRPKGGGKT